MHDGAPNYEATQWCEAIFFCDNYYTWHTLASSLYNFTDGEAHLIGTVKFTNVDVTNRYHLSKAFESMKDAP
jgi:hypothetical protein